ncbi:MAG: hypothetical protein GY842_21835 [bacterium]|nr:hypothetical protein [bacterium]
MGDTLVLMLMIAFAAMPALGTEDPPAPTPRPAQPESMATPAASSWVLSRSAYPEGIQDETAYQSHWRTRRQAYAEAARRVADPESSIEYSLAAANLVLSYETEPYASRWLLGLERGGDVVALRAALQDAQASLKRAAEQAEGLAPSDDERAASLRRELDMLVAFTGALDALWSAADEPETLQARRRGAVYLAVLLEHEREDIAASALLWQAVLYQQMGRLERVAGLVPLATEAVGGEAWPYELFTRLLRCRLIAEQGGYAAACSVLLQLEERVHDWTQDGVLQDRASRAATLVRRQILEQWRGALDPDDDTAVAWCGEAIARLDRTASPDGGVAQVYRLGSTIPLIVTLPELPEPTPTTLPTEASPAE